jgi:hypothetical protein
MSYSGILGILAAGILLAATASANQVTWDITGQFDDGGTISGSFVYDADLNQFSSVDVTTSAGSVLSGALYTLPDPCCAPAANFLLFVTTTGDLTGTPVFSVGLASLMTDAGGTIDLATSGLGFFSEESCFDSDCSGPMPPFRSVVSGDVSSVPEPSTLLLVLPLGVLIAALRRQRDKRFGSRSAA